MHYYIIQVSSKSIPAFNIVIRQLRMQQTSVTYLASVLANNCLLYYDIKRVVFNQVSLFLSQNNKLDAKQSGFRSGHSTETALLSVTEALRIAKADSKSSVLILLDLSAAFDTVNHQILPSTLSSLDITGIPLRWFESYLTGRSFKVAWEGRYPKHIGSWTPPLLHIHYITGSHHTGTRHLLPFLR